MKKSIFAQIIVCTFTLFASLSTYAGATNSDSSVTEKGTTTTEMNPARSPASDSKTTSEYGSRDVSDSRDGEDHDYGWIGLIGLIGLAGLFRKSHGDNRVDTNRVPNR